MNATDRFARHVSRSSDSECWLWTGTKRNGYGVFLLTVRPRKTIGAHCFAYIEASGPIPDGLEVDHLCRNRACVRPDHLEAVPHAVNMARIPRSPKCRRGHDRQIGATCKQCNRENVAAWNARNPGLHNARCRGYYARSKANPAQA